VKEQEYDVTYWPDINPSNKQTTVLKAHSKEDALNVAQRQIGINYRFKIKRRNYNWTGKGVVSLHKEAHPDV